MDRNDIGTLREAVENHCIESEKAFLAAVLEKLDVREKIADADGESSPSENPIADFQCMAELFLEGIKSPSCTQEQIKIIFSEEIVRKRIRELFSLSRGQKRHQREDLTTDGDPIEYRRWKNLVEAVKIGLSEMTKAKTATWFLHLKTQRATAESISPRPPSYSGR